AGHAILDSLVSELRSAVPGLRVNLFRCNVDYSGISSTWGCHESYLHRADPSLMAEQIVPHLLTRIVYSGAGGFNTLSRRREFVLSPRAPFIERTVSSESTHSRGVYHTKDESRSSAGYHRLHLSFGATLS